MAVVWRRRRRARVGHGRLRPLGGLARNEHGGEGKESNLPSPTRRDRPVLKTGGATGPLPSPLRLTARRWRPPTLAGRPSYGKTSRVPIARSVPPALRSSVPMSIALVNGPAAAAPRFRSRAESDTSVRTFMSGHRSEEHTSELQ